MTVLAVIIMAVCGALAVVEVLDLARDTAREEDQRQLQRVAHRKDVN